MAYVEAHQALDSHPKTKKAARLANVDRVAMLGYLLRFWWWTLDYAPDGDLSRWTVADIEDGVEWAGEPGLLFDSLCEAGFIDDRVRVHDWQDYGGKLLEKRRADAERKRNSNGTTADVRWSSAGRPTDGAGRSDQIRSEKNREDDLIAPPTPDASLSQAVKAYERHIGIIDYSTGEALKEFVDAYPVADVLKAIEKATGKRNPKAYMRTCLRDGMADKPNGKVNGHGKPIDQNDPSVPGTNAYFVAVAAELNMTPDQARAKYLEGFR